MADFVWLIYTIVESILVSILTIICSAYIVLYHIKSKNIECCKQRHNIIIDVIVLFIPIVRVIDDFLTATNIHTEISHWFLTAIFGTVVLIFMVKFAEYSFNIWYEIKLANSIHEQKWKSIIDNTHTNNWYTLNRKKWGNKSFINKVGNVYIVFQAGIQAILTGVKLMLPEDSKESQVISIVTTISLIPFFIPLGVIVKSYYDMKSFDDAFLIIRQYKRSGYIVAIAFASYLILYSIIMVRYNIFIDIMIKLSFWIPYHLVVLNDTYFVIKYVINKQSRNEAETMKGITVRTVLTNDTAIDILMKHLSEEFSMEILLSYLEFIQYKMHLKSIFNIDDDSFVLRDDFTPKSDIVFKHKNGTDKDNIQETIKEIVYELFQKYIENKSPFQINISSDTRKKLDILNNKDNWLKININELELYGIFDGCIKEMNKLLSYSLQRALKRQNILNAIQDSLIVNV